MDVRVKLAAVAFALCAAVPMYAQSTATVGSVCKDGTTDATVGRGACGHHGGVDKAATQKALASAKAANKTTSKTATSTAASTAATVTCKDGSSSKAGRGACARHGGVATSTSTSASANTAPVTPPPSRSTPSSSSTKTSSSTSSSSSTTADNNPSGASAKCKDGTYSHSQHHQGACGHHGGVAQWL